VAEVPDGLVSLAPTVLTQHAKSRGEEGPEGGPEPQKTQVFEGSLSAAELQDLVRFALHEEEFFEFEPDAVKAAIRDQYQSDGSVVDSTDATTTTFRVQTADRGHEVTWFRHTKAAWDFPRVERLLQLYALDRRLQQVFYVLVAGGPERVEAVVEKMEGLVLPYYRLYPDAPRLTAADLFCVTPSPDGTQTRFVFSRNRDQQVRNPLFEVAIDVPPQGEPTLSYAIPPQAPTRR
jgi:hypothetical protein